MFIKYTGWQYLLIDAANHFGLDKLVFERRIEWAQDNLRVLEDLTFQAENKPLYTKAVMAIRKAQASLPTGHLVALDACCSGIQVMSALTGCVDGATNTGLVDPNVRADAYTTCTQTMNDILGGGLTVPRDDAKKALMTSFYGSRLKPIELFGENTPELSAFYQAAQKVAPGAWELLQVLLASWQPGALSHAWKLPDGFDAVVKVKVKKDLRIEVDELAHATFSYEYYENEGTDEGLSNVANVVHSVDAYVLRSVHRRCNYDLGMVTAAGDMIDWLHLQRSMKCVPVEPVVAGTKLAYYIEQYERSGMADVVILPYLNTCNMHQLSDKHADALEDIILSMLAHKPFELVTVHDSFAAHCNNMNHVRQHYINIFAELAESNLLSDLLSQIHGKPGTYTKLSNNLGDLIRGSAYALT